MVKLDSTSTRALLDLEGYCDLGMVEDAMKAFQSLPTVFQNNFEALLLYSAFLYRHRQYLACHAVALRGIGLYPSNSLFWVVASSCLLTAGLVKERNDLLRAAADCCPDQAKFLRAMAAEPMT